MECFSFTTAISKSFASSFKRNLTRSLTLGHLSQGGAYSFKASPKTFHFNFFFIPSITQKLLKMITFKGKKSRYKTSPISEKTSKKYEN
jgi:hypothetical protein